MTASVPSWTQSFLWPHREYIITPNLHHQRWEMRWHFLQDKEPANPILHLKDSYFARKNINSKHRFQMLWEWQAQSIRVPHFNATSEKWDYDFHIKLRHFTHGQETLSALKGMDHHPVEQLFLLRLVLRKTSILTKVQRDRINNSSKFKTLWFPLPITQIVSHTAATKLCSSGSWKAALCCIALLSASCVCPLSSLSFRSSFHPSEILCSFSTLLFCATRRDLSSSSGGNSTLRVTITNWAREQALFTANIPELNFILPCMTRLHVPQDQCEDVFVLQDFTCCSWHYFLPIFKPVNGGERISSNGTGYKDVLPRSCCHWFRFADEPGLGTILRFCSYKHSLHIRREHLAWT